MALVDDEPTRSTRAWLSSAKTAKKDTYDTHTHTPRTDYVRTRDGFLAAPFGAFQFFGAFHSPEIWGKILGWNAVRVPNVPLLDVRIQPPYIFPVLPKSGPFLLPVAKTRRATNVASKRCGYFALRNPNRLAYWVPCGDLENEQNESIPLSARLNQSLAIFPFAGLPPNKLQAYTPIWIPRFLHLD